MKPIERVSEYHEQAIQGLRDLIKEYAQQANEKTYPFKTTIMAIDKYCDVATPTPITINNIIVEDGDVIICYDGCCEDVIELFSYDETYDILCNLCKNL